MYDELHVLDIKLVFPNQICFIVLYFLDINKFNEAFNYFSRFVGSTRIDNEIFDKINANHYKIKKSNCTEETVKEIIKEYNFKALS